MISTRQHRLQRRTVEVYKDPENETVDRIKPGDITTVVVGQGRRAALGTLTNVTRAQVSKSSKTSKGFHHSTPVSKEDNITNSTVVKKFPASNAFCEIYHDESSIWSSEVEASASEVTVPSKIGCQVAIETSILPQVKEGDIAPSCDAVSAKVELFPQPFTDISLAEEVLVVSSNNKIEESFVPLEDVILGEELRLESLLRRHQDRVTCVTDYSWDIYEYLREAETRNRPHLRHFSKQPAVTPHMRSVLVDWLIEVTEEYKLQRETIFLAVNYMDRFLSLMSVVKEKLQLLGICCLFLAAKYEETCAPSIGDFAYICDNTYTVAQIVRMERGILQTLSYEVTVPTAHAFCEKILTESGSNDKTSSMAMFLLELTLLDVTLCMTYLPSVIACACICIANYSFEQAVWPTELIDITEYLVSDFTDCLCYVYHIYTQSPSYEQQATRRKYVRTKYHQVAAFKPRPLPFRSLPESES